MRHFLKLEGMNEPEARHILTLTGKAKKNRGKKVKG